MASETSGAAVDTAEGRRLLERWRNYTLAYANDAPDVTLEDWEEATKEAEDWAVENGLVLLSRVAELESRARDLEAERVEYMQALAKARQEKQAAEGRRDLEIVANLELRAALDAVPAPSVQGDYGDLVRRMSVWRRKFRAGRRGRCGRCSRTGSNSLGGAANG